MPSHVKILAYSVLAAAAACGNDDHAMAPDAPAQTADAPASGGSCGDGGTHFIHTGAMQLDSPDFGFVTVAGKVDGFMGAQSPATTPSIVSLTPLHIISVDLEVLGAHDVATENFMEIVAPVGASCDPGNTVCSGFYAQSGTFTVLALHPRYQATFTLGDLYERHDSSGTLGAALAGTITGCVDKANP